MTVRQKIEELTNRWYGYAVFGALIALWSNGIGVFSLLRTFVSFFFSTVFIGFLGRRLLAKSSLTRFALVIVTTLSSLFGAVTVAKMGWSFFQTFSFSVLVYAVLAAVGVLMNVTSFRVLTDKSVKAYFN